MSDFKFPTRYADFQQSEDGQWPTTRPTMVGSTTTWHETEQDAYEDAQLLNEGYGYARQLYEREAPARVAAFDAQAARIVELEARIANSAAPTQFSERQRTAIDGCVRRLAAILPQEGFPDTAAAVLVKLPNGSVESFSVCFGSLDSQSVIQNICRPGKDLLGIREYPLHEVAAHQATAPEAAKTTRCWSCDAPYRMSLSECPLCFSVNANANLDLAQVQQNVVAAPTQAREGWREDLGRIALELDNGYPPKAAASKIRDLLNKESKQ